MNIRKSFARASILLFLLGGALLSAGCRGGGGAEKKAAGGEKAGSPAGTSASTPLATQVSVAPVRSESISEAISVTGALVSQNDVTVSVKSPGKILAVFVREGDVVRAGQIVARQDPADLQAQQDSQRANLSVAQSRLEQSRALHRNSQTTLKWTDAQTRSAVKQAQAALEIAKSQAEIVQQGARPQERKQSEENLKAAQIDRDKARADLRRYQELYRQQAVAAQQLDQMQAIADSAEARYNSAAQSLSLVREGSRREDILRAQAAVEQANQALAQAQSNREQVNLRRIDVENAFLGIASAEAGVRQARAAVQLAAQALGDLEIRSPIDGVVAERKAEPGMQLGVGRGDVLRIVSLQSIYFDALLPEAQYSKAGVGAKVEVEVYAITGKKFQGTVVKLFPVANSARTFTARISLNNAGNVLRPQMFASGKIVVETHANTLIAPRDSILDVKGSAGRVFVVVNGKVEERKVTLGISNGAKTEVLTGLQSGDILVIAGQGQIQSGDKVEVVASENAPAS